MWTARTALVLAAAGALWWAPWPAGAQAEPQPPAGIVEEDLSEDTAALLAAAEEVFASADQPRSIAMFGRVIAELERRLAEDRLSPEGRDQLTRSLFRRAEARFNIGERTEAEQDLAAILRLDPAFAVPEGSVSPKLVELLEQARSAAVGVLDPLIQPPDADLVLDGSPSSVAAGPRPVLAGPHRLEVRRPGYAPVELEIEIPPGASLPVELELERVSAVVRLRTSPAGVEVVRGGEVAGVSEPGAGPGDELSAELAVDGFELGEQELELRKEGYRPVRVRVTVAELTDYALAPVVLEPARGTLLVSGVPDGAEITIDEEPRRAAAGGLSVELPPGGHLVRVRGEAGGLFERRFELADRQTVELEARLRPSLALLGVLGADRVAATRLEEELGGRLGGLAEWALVDRAARGFELVREVGLDRQRLRQLAAPTATATAPDWSELQGLLDRELGGSVYLLAVLSDDLYASQADLWLWSAAPGPSRPARWRLTLEPLAGLDELIAALDRPLRLTVPWLGARLIDSSLVEGALVAGVTAGGPAAAAGLRPGEALTAVGGQPVATAAAAAARLAALAPGAEVELELGAAGERRRVQLTLGASPAVLPLGAGGLPAPVLAARLLALEAADEAAAPLWLARLNRGVVLMRGGDWRGAVEVLRAIEAPDGPGVGQGTVDYLLGLALLEADPAAYRDSARGLIARAAEAGATLRDHDGPRLAPRAEARLETLVPPGDG